ncbi:hypothetical protein ACWKT5_02910 [Streptomyces avermitilis]
MASGPGSRTEENGAPVAVARPAARTRLPCPPGGLPLGMPGPAAATGHMRRQRERHEGAVEIGRHPDEGTAREVVEDRTVYGAVIVTPEGPSRRPPRPQASYLSPAPW